MHRDSKFIAEAYLKNINEETVDIDVQELGNVINLVASSNLPAVVKANVQNLLKNTNVVSLYKQTKSNSNLGTTDADAVNLQAGSVSEPGSPSATTGASPQQSKNNLTYSPQQASNTNRFSF